MKWLAKRFRYTRELQKKVRELDNEVRILEVIKGGQQGIIKEWENIETQFSRMTLGELEIVMTGIVDYQRALKSLFAADPVQERVAPIFKKYNVTWERNTLVDTVIKEAEEYARQNAERRSSDDK